MNEKYEKLKIMIIEKNLMIESRNTSMRLEGVFSGIINFQDDSISFEDVLYAIDNENILVNSEGYFLNSRPRENAPTGLNLRYIEIENGNIHTWDIRTAYSVKWEFNKSLEYQSEKVWDFLLEMLKQ